MLSIEETNAVVRGQLLRHYFESDIELEEEDAPIKTTVDKIWIRCNYVPTEFEGNVTPIAISPASTCTFWVNSETNYTIPSNLIAYEPGKFSLGDASNADRFEVSLEVPFHQQTELQWVEFCKSLFPGHREHTPEERRAYSDFIDLFFEEVEI